MEDPPLSDWESTPLRRHGQPKIAGMVGAKPLAALLQNQMACDSRSALCMALACHGDAPGAVTIAYLALYVKPQQIRGCDVVVLVASALNYFLGMGGRLGRALGVIGGVLALSAKE
jgi:hypothetical protein